MYFSFSPKSQTPNKRKVIGYIFKNLVADGLAQLLQIKSLCHILKRKVFLFCWCSSFQLLCFLENPFFIELPHLFNQHREVPSGSSFLHVSPLCRNCSDHFSAWSLDSWCLLAVNLPLCDKYHSHLLGSGFHIGKCRRKLLKPHSSNRLQG